MQLPLSPPEPVLTNLSYPQLHESGLELAAAWANQPDFKVELVSVTPRTHYRVKTTPPEGAKPQQAVVLLRAVGPQPAGTGLTFYARVK